MNDPNGVIQVDGHFHLFYQHNPHGPLWGDISWGHAVSDDLIHWTDLPLALTPTEGSYDETGCFSGSCIVSKEGTPTIFYTATRGTRNEIQLQAMATSNDNLETWHKYTNNPIISEIPPEANQNTDFRDPYVWREDDIYYMIVGSRLARSVGDVGTVFLYRSVDLVTWEYLNPILSAEDPMHGVIWECPNLFQLDDKWVLIISAHQGHTIDTVHYFVGNYVDGRFLIETGGVADFGDLYAPLTLEDDSGRRIMFGWLREARSETDQRMAGWSGVQSVPRELYLDELNRLNTKPVHELEAIRGSSLSVEPMPVHQITTLDIRGLHLDIEAEFEVEPGGHLGLRLACSADGNEKTDIVFDAARSRLVVNKQFPRTNGAVTTHSREVPHALDPGELLSLRILLDGSVLEIIANGRTSLSRRLYPSSSTSDLVKLYGQSATIVKLNIWKMPTIWQSSQKNHTEVIQSNRP